MDSILDWMTSTPIAGFVLNYPWTWPTLEALHFFGLCLLIGAVLIMDLRLMGMQRIIPLAAVHRLMPIAIGGFAINLITGVLFIFGDAHRYAQSFAFQIKMLFVLLAGLNFWLYYAKVEPQLESVGPAAPMPPLAKVVGFSSLVFWFAVLAYGRLIPYIGTGGG